jgi:carbohydrate-binding DOMON domain-containing protein
VPLSALRGVEVLDDAHAWTGIGVGMRVPGVATVATVRGHGEKVFVAVHGDTPRGVRVRLEGAPWDEWIVGCADPEAVAATLAPAS